MTQIGQHLARADADLALFGGIGQHGIPRRFRARARRGGDGDEMRLLTHDVLIEGIDAGQINAGIFIQQPGGFRRVDARSAAEGDDPIGLVLRQHGGAAMNQLQRGLRLGLIENDVRDAGRVELRRHKLNQTQAGHVLIGNDDGQAAGQLRQMTERFFTKDNVRAIEIPHGFHLSSLRN